MAEGLVGLHGAVIPQAGLLAGIEVAAKAGFGGYEPEVVRAAACSQPERIEAREKAAELGIAIMPLNEIEAFTGRADGKPEEVLELAESLRTNAVTVIAAPGSQTTMGESELRELCAAARGRHLALFFEMLCFADRAFNTLAEARRLVEPIGMKLAVDAFHFIVSGVTPEAMARLPKELIGVVHISDALVGGKSYRALVDADRVLPGEGNLPLVEFMDAVRSTGYHGPMSVEVFHPKYAAADPFAVGEEASRRTSELLRSAGWEER